MSIDDDDENNPLFRSAYDEIQLEGSNSNSTSSDEQNELPFINDERHNPLRRYTPPITRVEQSLYESRFTERSQNMLPELEIKESRESFYWRWIMFGVPTFYGIMIAFISTVRTFSGYHDYMTKFTFWWAFTFEIGITAFLLYTKWRKQRDAHFLSWWTDRPINNQNDFNDNL